MNNKLQAVDSIAPVGAESSGGVVDPVKKEYEEGKRFFENKDYGQAAAALHNALVAYEEKNDEAGVANACNFLGKVCLARDDNDNALKHFQRVLAICEESNDRMSIIAVLQQIVQTYKNLEMYEKSIAAGLDLLDHYQDNRDVQGAVTTLEEMADIYLKDGKSMKAADAYKTISSIHKNFGHDNMAAKFLEKSEKLAESS